MNIVSAGGRRRERGLRGNKGSSNVDEKISLTNVKFSFKVRPTAYQRQH